MRHLSFILDMDSFALNVSSAARTNNRTKPIADREMCANLGQSRLHQRAKGALPSYMPPV